MRPKLVSQTDSWTDRLIYTTSDPPKPRPLLANCITAFRYAPEWKGVLAFNEVSYTVHISASPPWGGKPGEAWKDNDDRLATKWLQENHIYVNTATTSDAIQTVARENSYNPLLDFLNNAQWDGWERTHNWLTYYLGVEDTEYSRAVGRCWLISAVARAFQPGCKADHCLILEGPQGRGKSSALRALAGDDLFTDYISNDLGSKEASILCLGVWIVEFAELEGILHRPSKLETVKAFLSRTDDRYRPHYARHPIRVPRQCIFAATTNRDFYMHDESGNRRFWPVRCNGRIDVEGIARDRDQIWAEAVSEYLNGRSWWLTDGLEADARAEQAARFDADPWQETIADWIAKKKLRNVSVHEILMNCLHKTPDECQRNDQMRVASSLKAMGWASYRAPGTGRNRWRIPGSQFD